MKKIEKYIDVHFVGRANIQDFFAKSVVEKVIQLLRKLYYLSDFNGLLRRNKAESWEGGWDWEDWRGLAIHDDSR